MKRSSHKWVITIVVLLVVKIVWSQPQPLYSSLSAANGLPSNEVYSICQDANGLMWMGTDRGLASYNGQAVKTLSTKDGLPGNVILKLYLDYKNRLWGSTYQNGVFYIEDGKVVIPPFNTFLLNLNAARIKRFIGDFYVDSTDHVYMSVHKYMTGYIEAHILDSIPQFVTLNVNPKEEETYAYSIYKNQTFLFDGIYRRLFEDESFYGNNAMRVKPNEFSLVAAECKNEESVFATETLYDEKGGIICIGINNILYTANLDSVLFEFNGLINDIDQVDSMVYISTGLGLYEFKNTPSIKNLENVYFKKALVSRLFVDHENVKWVTTVGEGVYKIPSFNSNVSSLEIEMALPQDFGSYYLNRDTLNLVYKTNLFLFDLNKSSSPYFQSAIPEFSDRRAQVKWFKNEEALLVRIGEKSKTSISIERNENGGEMSIRKSISKNGPLKSKLNDIVVSKNRDTIHYLMIEGFETWINDKLHYSSRFEFNKDVTCLLEGNSAELWLGTSSGLFKYKNEVYTYFGDKHSVFKGLISDLDRDEFGNIVVSTKGEGLAIIYSDTIMFHNELSGLKSDFIEQVEVHKNQFWVNSQNGVFMFEKDQEQPYKLSYQLAHPFIGKGQIDRLLLDNGRPVFLNQNNIVRVDLNVLNFPFGNEMKLTNFRVNDSAFAPCAESPVFKSNENNIRIAYTINSLHQNPNLKFKYRLKGFFEDWITTAEREVQFAKLPAGSYSFEVKGINTLGSWTPASAILNFTIHEHFSRTWWFLTLLILSVLFILFMIYDVQRKKVIREKALLMSNIDALKKQINPHFILNGINSIRHLVSEKKTKQADQFLVKFSNLIRNVVYSTDFKRVLLSDEIKRIVDYIELEQLRFENSFEYKLDIVGSFKTNRLFIPPMLIQPLVENSIHHGLAQIQDGLLTIRIEESEKSIIICIKDNGKGFDKAIIEKIDSSKSIGLKNVLQRIRLISKFENKKHKLDINYDSGTEIYLTIEK